MAKSHHLASHSGTGSSNRWHNSNSLSVDAMPPSNASSAILANETSTSCSSWFDDTVIDDDSDDESLLTQPY